MRRWLAVAGAVARRNLHAYFTTPALVLPGLFFPLLFLTAFAGGLPAVSRLPGFDFPSGYTAFQFVFVLLQSAAFTGVFASFSLARDLESGFARRLFLATPRRSAVHAGYGLAALGRWLFTASVTTGVAFAFGLEVGGDGVDLFALFGLAGALSLTTFLWASGVALRARTIQAGPVMQVPVFLALFFAPVYVPLELLRGWLHAVATVNPATYLLGAGRDLIAGRPAGLALALGLLGGLAAVLAVWARRGLRKAEAAG